MAPLSLYGGIEQEHRRDLAPGHRRMRAGGRARITVFAGVDKESRKAIEKTWKSFADETSSHKRVFFNYLFNNLSDEQRRSLRHLGFERGREGEHLAEVLAHRSNARLLARVVGHEKVVEGTKVAADRFFLKNVSAVLVKAIKDRKGIFNFTAGSAKDDIATGMIAAIEHHNVRPHVREEPGPVDVSESDEHGGEKPIPDVSETDAGSGGELPIELPAASEPGVGPLFSPPGTTAGLPTTPPDLTSLAADLHEDKGKPVEVARIALKGLALHKPSSKFVQGTHGDVHRNRVDDLVHAASYYASHLMTSGLKPSQAKLLATTALNAGSVKEYQSGVARLLLANGARPGLVVSSYHLPKGAKLFHGKKVVKEVSISSIDQLKVGKTVGTAVPLSVEQKQMLSFHLLGRLLKLGSVGSRKGVVHLNRFVLKSHQGAQETAEQIHNLWYKPAKPSRRHLLQQLLAQQQALIQILMQGNAHELPASHPAVVASAAEA